MRSFDPGRLSRIEDALEELQVPRGVTLYIHSSLDWLLRAGFRIEALDVVRALVAWAGERENVAAPGFPARVRIGDFMRSCPTVDLRREGARTGMVSECLRRIPGARRSIHPWATVIAVGPDADWLAEGQELDAYPFHDRSPFRKLLAQRACLVGLGVSLNTNSFIHLVDEELRGRYPFPVYDHEPQQGRVIDQRGREHLLSVRVLTDQIIDFIEPSRMLARLEDSPDVYQAIEVQGTILYRLLLIPFIDACRLQALRALDAGGLPCWMERVGWAAREGLLRRARAPTS